VHFMAKKVLFEPRGLTWLMNSISAIPVDRENSGPSSIKMPLRLINNKRSDGIIPSDTRATEDVRLQRGAVPIAGHANAPVVPAADTGPNKVKELLRWKRPKISLGEAI